MKMRPSLFTKGVFCLLSVLVFCSFFFFQEAPVKSAESRNEPVVFENYDIRLDKSERASESINRFLAQSAKTRQNIDESRESAFRAAEKLRAQNNLKIEYNEDLRIPEVVSPDLVRKTVLLTSPTAGKRAEVLRSYINQNAELFGLNRAQLDRLEKTADYTNPDGNLSFVHFEQKIGGIPVFRGEIKAGFSRRNEIVRIINNLAPGLDYNAVSKDFDAAEKAVFYAAKHLDLQAGENDTKRIRADDLKITFERGQFNDETTAEKIYFPIDYGVVRTAWRVLIWTKPAAYYVIVDAETGALLWRKSITESQTQTATYNVYSGGNLMRTAESPAPIPFPLFARHR